jgi:hypothetical protein
VEWSDSRAVTTHHATGEFQATSALQRPRMRHCEPGHFRSKLVILIQEAQSVD